jgi:hypothetical protein
VSNKDSLVFRVGDWRFGVTITFLPLVALMAARSGGGSCYESNWSGICQGATTHCTVMGWITPVTELSPFLYQSHFVRWCRIPFISCSSYVGRFSSQIKLDKAMMTLRIVLGINHLSSGSQKECSRRPIQPLWTNISNLKPHQPCNLIWIVN